MKKRPLLTLIEPSSRQKQYRFAENLMEGSAEFRLKEIKDRLNSIRTYAVEQMAALAEEFRGSIVKYSGVSMTFADNASQAVDAITRITQDQRSIAIGKSSAVSELRPGLEERGYRFIDSYAPQFSRDGNNDKKIKYPWQLPSVSEWASWYTFDCGDDPGRRIIPEKSLKDIIALLGVNAASAEDGSIFFLQHSANIGTLLRQAGTLILVIGLDKIVQRREDALFQTQCAGTFGMESVLLDLKIGSTGEKPTDPLAEFPETPGMDRQLHIILLDNGRTRIAEGGYKDLLRCIGCKACLKRCACYHYLDGFDRFPRDYLWSFLTGVNPSIELCSHCAMCEIECPVDIPLPKLMSKAKAEYAPQIARRIDNRALMNMTRFAPLMRRVSPLANRLSERKLLRIPMEKLVGIDRRRKTPSFRYDTFEKWFRSRNG